MLEPMMFLPFETYTARASFRVATGLLLLVFLGELSFPATAVPGFSVRSWQPDNGLPQSAVSAVLQTRDSYVWVGTYNGLGRFDGVQFTVFDNNNTPELRNQGISSLFETGEGTLWIGHSSGELTRYQKGRFVSVEIRAPWGAEPIRGIGTDEAGDLWLLNEAGLLARLRDGLVLTPQPGPGDRFVGIVRSQRGTIWVLRNGRVSQLVRGQLEVLVPDLENRTSHVQGIGTSRDGGLWVVSDGQLSKWTGKKRIEDLGPVPWGYASSNPLVETKEGWLAAPVSDQGFYLCQPWKGGKALQFSRGTGFLSDWVTALSEDREGNLWVGTGGAGLHMVRTANVQTLSPPDDWQGRPILSVSAGRNGALWIGTEGAGIYRFQKGVWEKFGTQAGIENLYVWSAVEDRQGELWAATWNGHLYHLLNNRFVRVPGLEKITSPIPAIWCASQGGLWLGTGDGLVRYEAGKTAWFGQQVRPEDRYVRTVLEDADGAVWFGMYGGGLGCLKDGELKQFRKRDGLASDLVSCLHLDHDVLWIGTSGGGLTRLKQGRFAVINQGRGLPNNFICDIQEDGQGFFWMSSHGGIIRASKADLERCADGLMKEVYCLSYGLSDGMPTLECSSGFQPAGCQSADGQLWFPTTKGLVTLDPKRVQINPVPPPVVIESLAVDERPMARQQAGFPPLQIPPGRHRFEFQYTGLSFAAPEKVHFKYRLEGLEADWVQAGTRRRANYSYVPPGHYSFSVTACNNDGVWSETGAQIAFEVLPYFWQRTWFRMLGGSIAILGSGGVAWLAVRHKMRRKLERLQKQRAVERERARIAHDIHDDLGSNLTRITMLSDPERNNLDLERARANLNKIHRTARELTLAMDETVWALNPEHDTLDSLVNYLQMFAQDFLESAGIQFRLEAPFEVPCWPFSPEVRHNLFLACKEALNNTVKHAAASEVRISLKLEPAGFALVIEDNGRGFRMEPSEVQSGLPRTASSNGNGLRTMQLRLAEIGGCCEFRSLPGQGTQITFRLPLPVPAA
jgi:signal transduction histidine kinase/ligand-binding sensor domain-containing protein